MTEAFTQWCDERIKDCATRQQALAADCRIDEARFMQIRSNVYGIFRSVCTALKGDRAALLSRLTSIPASWEASLAQAEQHGDEEKACIERIKLETAAAIRHYVENMKEASP